MKYKGKKVPIRVFISSLILTIVLLPILLFLVIFIIPPFWTILVLGYMIGKRIGKRKKGGAKI